jgi:hypothetical protein
LTYPHDRVSSLKGGDLLRRIIGPSPVSAKLLISLRSSQCRETVQAGWKRDGTSVSGRRGRVTHKVFHRLGGEKQKAPRIMNLQPQADEFVRSGKHLRAQRRGGG